MLKLPSYTFLTGPAGSGKTTLSVLLQGQDQGLMGLSFADPLRLALLAVFHPDEVFSGINMDSINLTDEATKAKTLPLTPSWTYRQFMIDFGTFLKAKTSDRFLGDLAKRSVERFREYYSRIVFDDARTIADVAPFIDAYGAAECMIVGVERTGVAPLKGDVGFDLPLLKLPGIKKVIVSNNGNPPDMLDKMFAAIGGTPTPNARPSASSLSQL